MTDTLGAVTTYTYDDAGRTIAVTDARGATTQTHYDAAGRVIASTDALSHTTHTTRDAVGRAIRVTDPLGFATVTSYDRLGRVVATTNPLSHTTTYQYDAMGNTVAITNPRGLVSRTNYNVLGQRIADENPLGQVTTYQYDGMGRLTTVTDTLGLVTQTQYDAVGRTVGTSTSMGFSTAIAYDVRGNPSLITDTLGITTTTAVDQLGRTTAVTTAGQFVTQTRYDVVGNVNQAIDANGVTTGYRHDAAGRVTAVIEHEQPGQPSTTTTNVETLIGYDAVGNTIAITDANGHVRTTQYTLLNQPAQICDGLQRCTTITYTARGERATVTDPRGVVTTYTYDPAGRVVTITYSDGTPAVNYGYNPTNSVIAMVDGSGLTTYTYDALERMTTRSQNGVTITTTIAPDARSVTTEYWGTGSVEATRDPMGRTTTMSAWNAPATQYTYRGATTAVTAMDRPALGQQTTHRYRADGALLQIRYGPNTDLTYTRDAVGLPTMLAETLNGQALTTQLAYDARQRVVAVTQTSDLASVPASSQHYTLDAVGNRLHDGTAATTHTYDAADQVQAFTYDQAGNLLDDGQTIYSYDGANRLRQTQSATMTVAYGYNGWGTLVTETITHGLVVTHTLLLWDETSTLPRLLGTQASNGVETQYAYGPEGVHAVRERQHTAPWLVAYTQLDAQGTIRALITPAGVEQQRTHFSIWGTIRSQTGTSSNRLGYTGELMGHDGTVYLRARHYLPTMGRFLQQDSFAGIPTSPQSLHKYSYAHNSPAWHTDPSGNVVPLLLAAWAAVEITLSVYDAFTTMNTLLDPCVSGWEKASTAGLWLAGMFLPGGGYASGGKAAKRAIVNNLDHADTALYRFNHYTDDVIDSGKAVTHVDDATHVAHQADTVASQRDELIKVTDNLPCVPGNSFVAGTLVETSHGLVPIETLVVGDTVWAIDPQTNQAGYYPITWTTAHTATLVIELTIQPLTDTLGLAQEQIQATDHHPFWVYGRGWIDAGKLRVGDRLLGDAGYTITVVDVGVELQPVMVYNFTVATLHTYTIGHAGILVHNTGCLEFLKNELDTYADGFIQRGDLDHLAPGESKTVAIFKSPHSPRTFKAISGDTGSPFPEELRNSLGHNKNNTSGPKKTHRMRWNCAEMNCLRDILAESGVTDTTPIRKVRPILKDFEFTTMNIERTSTGFLKQYIPPCPGKGNVIGCHDVLDKLNMLEGLLEWEPRVR
ncbi:polymorphic toxin-type HINT domain-containing protein [Herpetosiphon gulosus]|uniref:Hint domain-containing protein n=1 Tax=Herpetosiphon gulosus TaxID=1973496 RepID=A0ABP9X196_9CHLR